MEYSLVPLLENVCQLAENPYWHSGEQALYFTDIPKGRIYRYEVVSGSVRCVYEGESVGGFTLQSDGSWLLFRINDVAVLQPNGDVETLIDAADPGTTRFNDVIADSKGRVFAGRVGATKTSGGLYRFDQDGSWRKLFDGTDDPNGLGFLSDGRTLLWTCSTTARIYAFDYDVESGELSNRRLWYQAAPNEGLPDGLTVDTLDRVWSARWEGARICLHSSDGKVLRNIPSSEWRMTSMTFGGPKLEDLYVTAASRFDERIEGAQLFVIYGAAKGQEEQRSGLFPKR